jgi:hypothetical protein
VLNTGFTVRHFLECSTHRQTRSDQRKDDASPDFEAGATTVQGQHCLPSLFQLLALASLPQQVLANTAVLFRILLKLFAHPIHSTFHDTQCEAVLVTVMGTRGALMT